MAGGKNQVTLTFAGDSSQLERSFDRVGSSAETMDRKTRESASGIDRVGESADNAETRFTGLASGIDGVTTLMDPQSPQEFAQGLADLADGIANFAVPALKSMATQLVATGRAAVTSAAQHVASAAKTVAGWVLMGAQAMANAARMAAAWLISLGPVGLVIAAIAAVIAIAVALGVGFDDVKNVIGAAWDFILGAIQGVWNWITTNWPLILAILTGPIGLAVLAITRHWNTIKSGFTAVKDWIGARINDVVSFFTSLPGRLASAASGMWDFIVNGFKGAINAVISLWNGIQFPSFTIGGWDPPGPGPTVPSATIGGWSLPQIPYLHTGGQFEAPPGQREGLAMLLDGETVLPPGAQMGGTVVNVYVQGSIRSDRDLVRIIRDEFDRGGFR